MKQAVLSTIAVLASVTLGFAQAPTTTTAPTTGTAAAKPKPLAAGDKSFLKNTAESLYFLITIADKSKRSANSEPVKKLGEKMAGDLNKIWGELGKIAETNKETLPTELKGSDKTTSERIGKAEADKFDKMFLSSADREAKKVARTFESGAKSLQDPSLKTLAETWGPTVKTLSEEIVKTEKEIAKK
jgi:predicted outer membrane protein